MYIWTCRGNEHCRLQQYIAVQTQQSLYIAQSTVLQSRVKIPQRKQQPDISVKRAEKHTSGCLLFITVWLPVYDALSPISLQ